MFAALPNDTILSAGKDYTFTYKNDATFQTTFAETVADEIRKTPVGTFGTVIVDRPLGSNNFLITVRPNHDYPVSIWKMGIENGLNNAGIKYSLVESEEGAESSKPGGLVSGTGELLGNTTAGISSILWSGLKPVMPWIILGGAGYIGFQIYMAKLAAGRFSTNPRKRRRRRK